MTPRALQIITDHTEVGISSEGVLIRLIATQIDLQEQLLEKLERVGTVPTSTPTPKPTPAAPVPPASVVKPQTTPPPAKFR